ncbi:MAG: HAD family hydrolase [Bacilli bacterium]
MNVYDFDNTIYNGDSGVDLIKYTFSLHPFLILKHIFKSIPYLIKYLLNKIEVEEFKENLFSFLKYIENIDIFIEEFVNKNINKIKPWYKRQQQPSDLVASASYDLWINIFCEKLGIKNIISTNIDKSTYKLISKNCSKEEKLRRIKEQYPNIKIKTTYSDSKNDIPLLKSGERGVMVKGNEMYEYYRKKDEY